MENCTQDRYTHKTGYRRGGSDGHIVVAVLFVLVAAGALHAEDRTSDEVVEELERRIHAMDSIIVEYKLQMDHNPPEQLRRRIAQERAEGDQLQIRHGRRSSDNVFRQLSGRVWREFEYEAESRNISMSGESVERIVSFHGNRVEMLSLDKGDTVYRGVIQSERQHPMLPSLEMGLGLRDAMGASVLEHIADGSQVWIDADGAEIVSMAYSDGKGNTHKWSLDAKLGYAAVSYQMLRDGLLLVSIACDDYREVGEGLWLPHLSERQAYSPDGEITMREVVEVETVLVDHPTNTPESYMIQWPLDAIIYDARIGLNIQIKSEPRPLSDALIETLADEFMRDVEEGRKHSYDDDQTAVRQEYGESLPRRRARPSIVGVALVLGLFVFLAGVITKVGFSRRKVRS